MGDIWRGPGHVYVYGLVWAFVDNELFRWLMALHNKIMLYMLNLISTLLHLDNLERKEMNEQQITNISYLPS